ncbi:MAG: hybrid sensor histidine kinase/response regulator, partial [Verrucomicrobiaceae bacterium]
ADRRKNEFLAMLSHELRNPLAAIRNALEVCEPEDINKETFSWARTVLLRQSSQLARLVDDLLDVARITRGKIHLRKTRMDAATALDRAVESVEPLISERKQVLTATYERRGTLLLDADPARLEQIVVNLLTNANKYTEVGGQIWLGGRKTSDAIIISVRDTGIGIQPEKLPEMFEIFTQGERSIDRSEGGLGLGLTIVRNLTELHGGTVTAQSEGLGKGTEFTITLPAAKPTTTVIVDGTAAPTLRHDGCKTRVLVVDDNVDTAHGLARLLERRNYVVKAAFDGHSALEAAEVFTPAIMLLDLGLPGMNGFELATRFRADARFQNATLIAISGYGQEEDRARSREAGFNHHLTKPVDLPELEALLEQAVRKG